MIYDDFMGLKAILIDFPFDSLMTLFWSKSNHYDFEIELARRWKNIFDSNKLQNRSPYVSPSAPMILWTYELSKDV